MPGTLQCIPGPPLVFARVFYGCPRWPPPNINLISSWRSYLFTTYFHENPLFDTWISLPWTWTGFVLDVLALSLFFVLVWARNGWSLGKFDLLELAHWAGVVCLK